MSEIPPHEASDAAHRLRNHVQTIASLLHLHADQLKTANAPDLLKKLQMRLEVIAETSLLAVGEERNGAALRTLFETVEKILSRVFERNREIEIVFEIGDVRLGASSLATLAQLLSELLGQHLRHSFPDPAPSEVAVRIGRSAEGQVTLSVRPKALPPAIKARAIDSLTSRMIAGLAASMRGQVHYDADSIYHARLIFDERAEPDAP